MEYHWEMWIFMSNCFGDLDGSGIGKSYWFWYFVVETGKTADREQLCEHTIDINIRTQNINIITWLDIFFHFGQKSFQNNINSYWDFIDTKITGFDRNIFSHSFFSRTSKFLYKGYVPMHTLTHTGTDTDTHKHTHKHTRTHTHTHTHANTHTRTHTHAHTHMHTHTVKWCFVILFC